MDLPWMAISPELQNGIQIINQIDSAKFQKFLNHIKTNSGLRTKNEMFTSEEATALERVFKINADEVILVIKVTLYILERMSKFLMKPSCILNDLQTVLNMNQDKAESFINIWRDVIKMISENYEITNFGNIAELNDPTWQLNIALCSHLNKKERQTTILMDMKTEQSTSNFNEKFFVELTSEELLNFNNQLEAVQHEVDAILRTQI